MKGVGLILVILGLIDMLVMIYSFMTKSMYASSFNIFAIVAGIFLIRGSLKAAQIVSWFAAFLLSGFVGILILMPFFVPIDLMVACVKLKTVPSLFFLFIAFFIFCLLIWIYRSLTSRTVPNIIKKQDIYSKSFWSKSSRGFWVGILFIITLGFTSFLFFHGGIAKEAKQRVAAQVGSGYKFYVSSMEVSSDSKGKHVEATIIAYNENEIKSIAMEWTE